VYTADNVTRSFIAVVDGSKIVTSGTNDVLLSFLGTASGKSSVTAARNFFTLSFNTTSVSPSLTLSGPFLSASLTDFRTGDPTANTFTFLFIGDGAQVTSTTTSPFMTFTNSTLDTAGDIVTLRRSTASTPSRLTLAGPLLAATGSSFNHTSLGFGAAFSTSSSSCCSAFFVSQGAQLSSTTSQALIQLTGSTVTGNDAQTGGSFFHVSDTFSGAPSGEVVASSSVSLAGPLLQATSSTITELFELIRVQNSTLTSTSTSPLVTMTGGSVTLGGALLEVVGGSGRVTLNGPVLSAGSSAALTAPGGLLATFNGGQLVVNTSTDPLFAFNGGTHSFGTTSSGAAFLLKGLTSEVTTEHVNVLVKSCDGSCFTFSDTQAVTVGTRKPVQHGGTLLDATGATLTTNKLVTLDTALLEATAPILNLSGGTLTVASDALDLVQTAKLNATNASTALINLGNTSTMTVTSGNLLGVRLGSFLNVAGDAVRISGGSILNISNGVLLSASGDSVVKIAGALVRFGTGGGTVNITNNLCVSTCPSFNGVRVFFGSTANQNNVVIGSGALVGGSINYTSINSAAISVDGANTRVNISASTF